MFSTVAAKRVHLCVWIHCRQKYWIFGQHSGNTRIWHFDLLDMAWHQPQTSIVTLIQLSCTVSWTKNAIYSVRNYIYAIFYWKVSFLLLRLKFSITSRVSIITLWICATFHLIIRYWHYTEFAISCQIAIWLLKQNSRKVWLNVQYLVIWHVNENLLDEYRSSLPKF